MILVFFAATRKFLDGIKVEEVLEYERRMIKYFLEHHPDVLDAIRTEPDLSDELTEKIVRGLEAFKEARKPIPAGQN